jgi:lipid-binding SYLF domain-containing protein
MRYLMVAALMFSLPVEFLQAESTKIPDRLEHAAMVMNEIMNMPENSLPRGLLDRAVCVGIIPAEKKLAFGFGGSYGRGVLVCRRGGNGPWGAPSMIAVHGGSYGLQIGGSETDLVFVVMNPSGIRRLLKSKGELGADASVAAGPVGRTASASTDLMVTAEILTYSRSRGLFAGVSLKGAAITQDGEANARLYGHIVDPKEILIDGKGDIPPQAKALVTELEKYSPRGGEAFAATPASKPESPPPPQRQNAPAPQQQSTPPPH